MTVPFHFDWSINIGSIGAIAAIFAVGYHIVRAINQIEFRVDVLWSDYVLRQHDRRRLPRLEPDEANDDPL